MQGMIKLRGGTVSKWVVWGSITMLTILELLPVYHVSSAVGEPRNCRSTIKQLVFVCPIDKSSSYAGKVSTLRSIAYDILRDRLIKNYKLIMVNPSYAELPDNYVKGNESEIKLLRFEYLPSGKKLFPGCKISMAYSRFNSGCRISNPSDVEAIYNRCFYSDNHEKLSTDLVKRMEDMFDRVFIDGEIIYMFDTSKSTIPLKPLPHY